MTNSGQVFEHQWSVTFLLLIMLMSVSCAQPPTLEKSPEAKANQAIIMQTGRMSRAEGVLNLAGIDRNTYQQVMAGRIDGQGYDGGHLIANLFGGAGERINLVPMLSTVNRGEFRAMELEWANALRAGRDVRVEVSPVYSGNSKVPDTVLVRYTIDGQLFVKPFNKK